MNGPLDDRTADALLGGRAVEGEPELTAFVADLTALSEAAPAPSAALAAMLEQGVVPATVPLTAPAAVRRTWVFSSAWARGALAGVAAMAAILSAAAAGVLPGRTQDGVADVVGWVTPFDLPRNDDPLPVPSPSVTPTPEESEDAGDGAVEPGDDKGGDADDSGPGSSDDGRSGSDDSTSGSDSGSGSDDGSSDSGSGSSGGSDDGISGGSDDHSPSPSPTPKPSSTPRESESPRPSASPTPSESGGSDDH